MAQVITKQPVTGIQMADWTKEMRPSLLYELARTFGAKPDVISFAGGIPDLRLAPKPELADAAVQAIQTAPRSLQYNRDLIPLKEKIVEMMAWRGVSCTVEHINITAGGQHAMDVLTRLLLNPGGQVMLEELVYTGIHQAIMPLQPEVITVPIDPQSGLDLEAMSATLAAGARPAFLYTIAASHNPVGVSLSQEKRERLVSLAQRYGMPLIEDDAYGFLHYEDNPPPSLRALDEEWVLYIGSFSKVLAPGFRLGWIVAPPELNEQIRAIKRAAMLSVAPLAQHIVSAYLEANDFAAHVKRLREEYGRRRDAMLQAMAAHFPPEVKWRRPDGGMFVWASVPEGLDTEAIVMRAVEEELVAFIPGKAFITDVANGRFDHFLRLSFALYEPERIAEGIARLGRVLARVIQESKV
jgi:2-aminoadipate transaminase